LISNRQDKNFGFFVFDDIPLFLLLALVVIAEFKYIASYICSNWTKVSLICYNKDMPICSIMTACKNLLLQCKWGLMKHWARAQYWCSIQEQPCLFLSDVSSVSRT
jgi:hypothetical protein